MTIRKAWVLAAVSGFLWITLIAMDFKRKALDVKYDSTSAYRIPRPRAEQSYLEKRLIQNKRKSISFVNNSLPDRELNEGSESSPTFRLYPPRMNGLPSDIKKASYCMNGSSEQKHIYYLKLHKTGSGTLSNLFLRFGLSRKLAFAIPRSGILFPFRPIQPGDIKVLRKTDQFDLLIHHSTFNPNIKKLFTPNTVTVASLREPFSLFVSMYTFFHYSKMVPNNISSSDSVVRNIERFIAFQHAESLRNKTGKMIMNRLSFRLGIPMSASRNRTFVNDYVNSILSKQIDIVTLAEYFDESVVLLKRKFCWRVQDIIYRGLHMGVHRSRVTFQDVSVETRMQLKELMLAEYIIYDFFNRQFWEAMWREGNGFFEEVRAFKIIIKIVKEFCSRSPSDTESITIARSPWNEPFPVTGRNCVDMLLRDGPGIQRILQQGSYDVSSYA